MFFSILSIIGVFSMPLWGIIFCLNLISIIENMRYDKLYMKNVFWFIFSFVLILIIFTILIFSKN